MRYLFQRIVHNGHRWTRPSIGRLGSKLDGGYLKDTGFGHEDWNLSNDKAEDGDVHGYMYYEPKRHEGHFNILFATYKAAEGWSLVGLYEQASFNPKGGRFSSAILERRARELRELDDAGSLGPPYRGSSTASIARRLASVSYRWRVRPENIHSTQIPILLPDRLVGSCGKYFARPTEITEDQYVKITAFTKSYADKAPQDNYDEGGDIEFPEGKIYQSYHTKRERSRTLVKKAKQRFRMWHGRLFCEACKFDFVRVYGSVGEDFIEVHHLKPVSELKPGSRTKLDELALVCSNCHRILHRRRPWMSISNLQSLLKHPI